MPKLSTMLVLGGAVVLVRGLRRRAAAARDEELAHLIANDNDHVPANEVVAGVGELYDVQMADDVAEPEEPGDDGVFDDGQTWLERLETNAAENGAEPGRVLDRADGSEDRTAKHPTGSREIPVADRGSGGPRGL